MDANVLTIPTMNVSFRCGSCESCNERTISLTRMNIWKNLSMYADVDDEYVMEVDLRCAECDTVNTIQLGRI